MLFPDALDGSAVKPRRGDTSVTLYERSVGQFTGRPGSPTLTAMPPTLRAKPSYRDAEIASLREAEKDRQPSRGYQWQTITVLEVLKVLAQKIHLL